MPAIDTVVAGDCLDVMAEMPDGCVDLIVTDPPYNLNKDYGADFNDNKSESVYWSWYSEIVGELIRVLGHGYLYISCVDQQLPQARQIFEQKGLDYVQTLIWHGPNVFHSRRRINLPWTCDYEPVLMFKKGKRQSMLAANREDVRTTAVLRYARPQSNFKKDPRFHPTQKPLMLYIALISRTPGNCIFDPFMGSGTTAVAAMKLGRRFYGCDINPEYVKLANERIAKARPEISQMSFENLGEEP